MIQCSGSKKKRLTWGWWPSGLVEGGGDIESVALQEPWSSIRVCSEECCECHYIERFILLHWPLKRYAAAATLHMCPSATDNHTQPPPTGVVGCSQNRVFLYSQSQTDTAVVPPKCPHMYPFWTDTVEVLLQSVHACPSGTDTGGAAAMPSPISVLDGH